ncbi:MAG: UbiA prenyltransferase family protein [Balneolaceae bacterium]|nr:UbiA prenyltransferase family protein [Balneolaceae bacterium]MCH8549955.1 UbiA family prenyltransferase [Balneolaceae bacterium]
MYRQIIHFIIHLRLHYQFFLLSGGYLLGGLMAPELDTSRYLMQFLNVHILLFGGATAFNSFWDKDEGPIGGLKHPPVMTPWMRPVSLFLMFAGLFWAFTVGLIYTLVYAFSLLLFWLYSTPLARWKGDPHLSLIAIAFSTGFNSVLMGTLAAGGAITIPVLGAALGASMILLSLYPVSQIFQLDEDIRRGDRTFAGLYGIDGVKRFYIGFYFSGLLILCGSLYLLYPIPTAFLFVTALISGVIITRIVVRLDGNRNEYERVMRVKLIASLSFVLFLLFSSLIWHEWIEIPLIRNYF